MNPIIRLAYIFFSLELYIKIKLHMRINNYADKNMS